jgi:hypothetical protein
MCPCIVHVCAYIHTCKPLYTCTITCSYNFRLLLNYLLFCKWMFHSCVHVYIHTTQVMHTNMALHTYIYTYIAYMHSSYKHTRKLITDYLSASKNSALTFLSASPTHLSSSSGPETILGDRECSALAISRAIRVLPQPV